MTKQLANYTKIEEQMNTITHALGIPLGIIALIQCTHLAWQYDWFIRIAAVLYGFSLIAMYLVSTIYHGVKPSMTKIRLRTLDHCTIYFLIAGTYSPILLSVVRAINPSVAIGLLIMEWGLGILAVILTAIDLKKYFVFSMICYIFMGWGIMLFPQTTLAAIPSTGFVLLLSGGIVYTIGAILYGVGKKIAYVHSLFHLFVLAGSILQYCSITFTIL
ncbi:MAG: hemolysin III family protein [Clostridia bacterium]|nr:hemolysin III family protein [Clostridia bacterium]